MKHLSFSAEIFIIGVNPYVIPPKDVLEKLFNNAKKNKGPIPVKGTLNDNPFTQTLVKYAGKWRLYLNTPMRSAAKLQVGDIAHVKISFDGRDRTIPMHPQFTKALVDNKKAKEAFEKLPASRQKEINRYLNNMKTQQSLERNISKVISHLVGDPKAEYFVIMRK